VIETLITDAQRRIMDFLEDEDARLLVLRTIPEQRILAARLIAAVEEQAEGWVLCYGVAEPFSSSASFYSQVLSGFLAHLHESREKLSREGIQLPSTEHLNQSDTHPDLPDEVKFASVLEDLTRTLAPLFDRLLLVLCPDSVESPEEYRRSIQRLCNATGSARVRYLALDDYSKPLLHELAHDRDRFRVLLGNAADAVWLQQLDDWLASPYQRVLGLPSTAAVAERRPLDRLQDRLRNYPHGKLVSLALDATSVDEFYRQSLDEFYRLSNGASIHGPVAPSEVVTEESVERNVPAYLSMEAQFARAAERFAQQSKRRPLVVALAPKSLGDAREWLGSLLSLAEEAVSPWVKYAILEPTLSPSEIELGPASVQVADLDLSTNRIEQAIREGLKSKDLALSPTDRLRYLSMMATLAASRHENDDALRYGGAAVDLAIECGAAAEKATAWMTMGNVLYQQRDYELARNAYSHVTSLAVDCSHDQLAAQGLENIGHTYYCSHDYPQAVACYVAAREYNAKLANVFGEGRALTWLGEAERAQRRWSEAEQAFYDALALYGEVRPELREAAKQARGEVLVRLAFVLEQTGNFTAAQNYRHQAQQLGFAQEVSRTP